jgi:hypothetical protein
MLLAALLRDRDDAPVLVRATSYLPPTTDLIASRHVVVARQKLYTAPGSPVICRVPVRIFFLAAGFGGIVGYLTSSP